VRAAVPAHVGLTIAPEWLFRPRTQIWRGASGAVGMEHSGARSLGSISDRARGDCEGADLVDLFKPLSIRDRQGGIN